MAVKKPVSTKTATAATAAGAKPAATTAPAGTGTNKKKPAKKQKGGNPSAVPASGKNAAVPVPVVQDKSKKGKKQEEKKKRIPRTRLRKKRSERSLLPPVDFKAVLELPERLAEILREWFHLSKVQWDACMDKLRYHGEEPAYRQWSKSKGPGKGRRHFAAPCDSLKLVQEKILCQFMSQIPVHWIRHETPGSSYVTNAMEHAHHSHVYGVDIVRAFPSVRRSRIRANLERALRYHLETCMNAEFPNDDLRLVLEAVVDLVSFEDRLPQGSPASPRIFAVVCRKIDSLLWSECNARSNAVQTFKLTAYVDGYAVSSDGPIAEDLQHLVCKIIRDAGFLVHTSVDKNRYYSPQGGVIPVVTGLALPGDGRVTIPPRRINDLRAELHALLQVEGGWTAEDKGKVSGLLGFVEQIYGQKLPAKLRHLVPAARAKISGAAVSAFAITEEIEKGEI